MIYDDDNGDHDDDNDDTIFSFQAADQENCVKRSFI